jgi:amino acid adenylation domain-containing protein/non-ribosomal peptide synthase protein (TIGR01720 family)
MTTAKTPTSPIADVLPLLPLQRGMLFHAIQGSASQDDPYVLQVSGRIHGQLDPAQVERAWQTLIARHPALRCAFIHKGQTEPRQAVLHTVAFSITTLDWQDSPAADQAEKFQALKTQELATPFNLTRPPLLRFSLIRIGAQEWHFIFTHHHIIIDGWSQSMLVAELYELMEADLAQRPAVLQPVGQFQQVVRAVEKNNATHDEMFWRNEFTGWQAHSLGLLSRAESAGAPNAARPMRTLGAELTRNLQEVGRVRQITPATLCQLAWAMVLARHTARRDIVYGVTVSGRADDMAAMSAIGMFVNTLPLRIAFEAHETLADLARRLAEKLNALGQRSHCDLSQVQKWAGISSAAPLLQSLVAFENFPLSEQGASSSLLSLSDLVASERTSLPLALVIVPGNTWRIALQTDCTQIALSIAQAMLDDFVLALETVLHHWHAPCGQILDLLASAHTLPIAAGSDQYPVTAPDLLTAWRDSVRQHGARTAVSTMAADMADTPHTYAELDQQSEVLAASLRLQGVVTGDRVAICARRDTPMLVAMLAVLKAGGAYVPLDPHNPAERLGWILLDARPSVILMDQTTVAVLHAALESAGVDAPPMLALDQPYSSEALAAAAIPLMPALAPNAPAYVIYTSGSTGRPKGVLVTHNNVLQLFSASRCCFDFGPQDKWSLFHSFAFDFSVWEIWGPWLSGGETVIVPSGLARDPASFVQSVADVGITVLSQTPSAFSVFAQAESRLANKIDSLRWIVFGGEALTLASLSAWVARHGSDAPQLINMYGITETTVHVTWRRIVEADIETGRGSLIGEALPHLQMQLMDQDGRPVPTGATGEIWVGGQSVSAGYLNMPALTAERFVPDASSSRPGMRAYRSGDLARRHDDGEVDYLGRIDHQVKIRGYRIETGEIEQALLTHDQVATASVGVWQKEPDGDIGLLGLCAWVVPKAGLIDTAILQTWLAERLPTYMVPDSLILVEQIPLTINGKADRSRLPAPQPGASDAAMALPTTDTERLLCEAMAGALGRTVVGIDDNYFSLGGDSIRSLRFASTAEQKGVLFPLKKLFEFPTIRALAHWIDSERAAASLPPDGAPKNQVSGPANGAANHANNDAANKVSDTRAEIRPAFFGLSGEDRAQLPPDAVDAYPLSRLQAGMLYQAEVSGDASALYLDLFSHHLNVVLDQDAFTRALDAMVSSHPALRTSFHMGTSTPLQVIHASASLQVEWHDLRDCSPQQVRSRMARNNETLRCQPYPLNRPGLMRLRIDHLADQTCWLSMGCHHAILDGWSVAMMTAQLLALYDAARSGVVVPHQEEGTVLADFVRQEQAVMQSEQGRQFWQQQLNRLPTSELPRWGDVEHGLRPEAVIELPQDTGERLQALCQSAGIPVKSWLMAVAAQVFGWSAGSAAFSLGLVVNGRPQSTQGANALGLFLNTIPLALQAQGTWRELATSAFRSEGECHEWRVFPLAEMVRMHAGKKPFEVNLNFVHFRPLAGLEQKYGVGALESLTFESTDIPLTINFSIDPEKGTLAAKLVADDSFSTEQIDHLAQCFAAALERLVEAPDAVASCASEEDRQWSVQRFNQTAVQRPFVALPVQVLRRLEAQPGQVALIDQDGVPWLASEFLERILAIASLLQSTGPVQQCPVALYQKRSVDLIASQIAVLALGGYYIPLDTEAAPERITDILQDLGRPRLLSDTALDKLPFASHCQVLLLNQSEQSGAATSLSAQQLQDRAAAIIPTGSAYAIYTSGSSGKPKGVLIGHDAMANHMAWMAGRFKFGPKDRILHRTRPSFDASVWEVWAALRAAAVLLLAPADATTDPAALLQAIETSRATVVQLVPSLLEALITEPDQAALNRLRLLFVGGEALRKALALEVTAGRKLELVNLYGPTEVTIDATFEVVDSGRAHRSKGAYIPIGLPIDNVSAIVIGPDFEPLPTGAIGELLLCGVALGQGYLNAPAMTAERFVPDPFGPPGARAFRSRDLVRRLADGRLEYVGRLDRQVKIGGNRVELEEIEAVLSKIVSPRRCAVAAVSSQPTDTGGVLRLVAFVEAHEPALTTQEVRTATAARLPGYMVPAQVHFIPAWPLMPSGKTDYAALLRAPAQQSRAAGAKVADAAGPVVSTNAAGLASGGAEAFEAILRKEMATLLGLEQVSRDDDFFSMGGDSISAMQLISRVRRLGMQLSAKDIFTHRTVAKLAQLQPAASQTTVANDVAPPSNEPHPFEAILAKEVGILLGLDNVSPEADFFSIGGDSISAMQLISRVRRLGLTLSAKDIFTHRTIASLAQLQPHGAVASSTNRTTSAAVAAPPATWPMLPIQQWFFRLGLANPNWYHQTVALKPRASCSHLALDAALRQLGQRHVAFGSRFDPVTRQVSFGDPTPQVLSIIHKGPTVDEDSLYQAVNTLQIGMSASNGPLWGAVIACKDSVADASAVSALVVVAHHLVIDGVSWRILLDELTVLLNGGSLSGAGISLAQAALTLDQWQPGPAETRYWQELLGRIPVGRADAACGGVGAQSVIQSGALDSAQTNLLIQLAPDCKASMEELLLAALMQALSVATAASFEPAVVVLEGHGRDVLDGQDLSRTVGWFTTQRPILLDAPLLTLSDAVRMAKSQLRAIPDQGGGWLKVLAAHTGSVATGDFIVFNYLGRFDGTVGTGDAPFDALEISLPPSNDPANHRSSLMDVVGLIENQCLRLTLDADGARMESGRVAQLLTLFVQNLVALGQFSADQTRAVWLTSDFPLVPFAGETEFQRLLETGTHAADGVREVQFLPCTPLQQGMVFGQALAAGSAAATAYTQQLDITLSAMPDARRLQAAFNALSARHEVLRTRFVETETGRVLQVVMNQVQVPFDERDFSTEADPLAHWHAFVQADCAQGFELTQAPLLRVTLARAGPAEWHMLWTHHHLISDGWSQPILLQELLALYLQAPLPAPAAIPAGYWHWLAASNHDQHRQYWQQRFAAFTEPTLVARSIPLAPVPAAELAITLPASTSTVLQQFCRQNGLTLAAVMQAAWGFMLGKMLHRDDVAFGMVVSGRPAEIDGSENWVGMFINTLPVRVTLDAGAALLPWLTQLGQEMAQGNDSAHLALPQIQSWVNQGRALFDTIVVFENYPMQEVAKDQSNALAVVAIKAHEVNEFPLSLYVEGGASTTLTLHFDPARVDAGFVHAIGNGMAVLLDDWANGKNLRLGASASVSALDRERLAALGTGPSLAGAPGNVIDRFAAQAARTPDAMALEDADGNQYTYAALLQQVQQLAAALQQQGIGNGALVAVMGEHRAPLLIAILAVQWCGACFIPLDPTFPVERLQMILSDSKPGLVLHDSANQGHAALVGYVSAGVADLLAAQAGAAVSAHATPCPCPATALAYVLFTSGSTGRPKGVQISQAAFANALASFAVSPGLSGRDVFGAATTISFDISLLELFLPLTVGAQVVMIDKQVARDGARLAALLAERKISAFQGTPSTWKLLCAVDCRLNLTAWCGGESLPRALRDELLQRFSAVWNLYGPTETTIWSAVSRQTSEGPVLAGAAIGNTTLFLIDAQGQLVPPHAIGEICIGGHSVMQGYINQPDLSAAAFVPDPLQGGMARAYRTGDLGRWHGDGALEVLGRRDRQIKLAGFRIEPGDIEAALRAVAGVHDAAVTMHTIGATALLVGYLVMPGTIGLDEQAKAADLARVRQELATHLPHYMLPAQFMLLPALPLTLNGKLDQRALPLPTIGSAQSAAAARAPQGPIETVVLAVWRAAFEHDNIGVDDDFFELGGHSFTATRMHARLVRIFGNNVPLNQIFHASSVARLSQAIMLTESAPGDALRRANAYIKLQSMTPEQRAALRARAKQ